MPIGSASRWEVSCDGIEVPCYEENRPLLAALECPVTRESGRREAEETY